MNITIPPEALEAFPPLPEPYQKEILATSKNTVAVREGYEMGGYVKTPDLYTEEQMEEYARVACIAMLKAWPGMHTSRYYNDICLPLPQENTNAET